MKKLCASVSLRLSWVHQFHLKYLSILKKMKYYLAIHWKKCTFVPEVYGMFSAASVTFTSVSIKK